MPFNLPVPDILKFYLVRWRIEDCYRTLKQNFDWGDYQMRSLQAIECHVLLVMVAYAFVELQRLEAQVCAQDPKMLVTLDIFSTPYVIQFNVP